MGKDDLGEELLDFVEQSGLKIDHIQQTNQFDTGKVIVTLDAKGSASYDIAQPAAWDKITVRAELLEAVQKCDLFLFGSLATRDEVTKQTLFQLLTIASFKVFDVNLRPPHYTYDLLDYLRLHERTINVRFVGEEYADKDFTGRELTSTFGDDNKMIIYYNRRSHNFSSSELRERIQNA